MINGNKLLSASALFLLANFLAAPSAFASEKVLERCEGWIPQYFVEMIKIENNGTVVYQINLQGKVTNFSSAANAKSQFDKDCAMVKGWE